MIDLPRQHLAAVVFAALILGSALAMPLATTEDVEPKTGEVYTPNSTPAQASVSAPTAAPASNALTTVPDSKTTTATSGLSAPTLKLSAGSQTTAVTAITRGGEPALRLTDNTIERGRWVGVPTTWLQAQFGYVPQLAQVRHQADDGTTDTYAAPIERQNGMAMLYVRNFSTNTVTFSGTTRIDGDNAVDGTQYTYDLTDLDAASNFTINVTGDIATAWDNETASGVSVTGGQQSIAPAGNLQPLGPGGGDPKLTVTVASLPYQAADYGTDSTTAPIWGDTSDGLLTTEYRVESGPTSVSQLRLSQPAVESGDVFDVDIYVNDTVSLDGSCDGTLVKNAYDPPDTTGTVTINVSNVTSLSGEYELCFDTQGADSGIAHSGQLDGESSGTDYAYTDSGTTTLTNNLELDVKPSQTEVTAEVDGVTTTIGTIKLSRSASARLDIRTSTSRINFTGDYGTIDTTLELQERTETVDPAVYVNGQKTSYSGRVSDGSTVSLTTDTAWLQSGSNNVTVTATVPSSDAPTTALILDYEHDATDNVSVNYAAETFSERYNISRTYASDRTESSLEIPFEGTVVSVRAVEVRINGGSWQSVSTSNYNFNGTTLTVDLDAAAGGSIAAGDTIETRANASKVAEHNIAITVTDPNTPASDAPLNATIKVDSISSGAYLGVGTDGLSRRLHYIDNEDASYTTNEYAVLDDTSGQELHLPAASAGDTATIRTLPVDIDPRSGTVEAEVPESRVNRTQPVVRISPGAVSGNAYDWTLITATGGKDYILFDETNEVVEDSGTASSPLTLTDDDDNSAILQFQLDSSGGSSGGGSGAGGGAGAVVVAPTGDAGNIIPLIGLALGLVGLALAATGRGDSVTVAADDVAERVNAQLRRLPAVGPALAPTVSGVVKALVRLLRPVLTNQLVALGLAVAMLVAAINANIIRVPGGNALLLLPAVAVLSLVVLQRLGEFSTARWVGVNATAVVAFIQLTSQTSLITALTRSQLFPILVLAGLYLAYKAVQGISTPDETQTIVVRGTEQDDSGGGGS